jgi:hypothetical protein
MIERTVDRVLAMQPAGAFAPSREQLLEQYEAGEARQRMLQEIIQRELFSRRARELGLDREASFQQTRSFLETELLAGQFLSRELAKIQPTDVDLEAFYQAYESEYRQPESASIVVLPLGKDQPSDEVLSQIETADDFRQLAREASETGQTVSERIIRGQPHPRFGETAALFDLQEGEWMTTPVGSGESRSLVLVETKTPATTPPLAEIRPVIEADYRRRKREELTEHLSSDLMSRYDVEIITDAKND